MQKLKDGTYNEFVKTHLPYSFRTGVIPRAVLWEREPEWKDSDMEGLPEETISAFRALLNSGINRRNRTKNTSWLSGTSMQDKKTFCISMPVLELQTGAILRGKISGHLRGFWMDVMTPVIAAIVIFMQRLILSLFKRLPVITLET